MIGTSLFSLDISLRQPLGFTTAKKIRSLSFSVKLFGFNKNWLASDLSDTKQLKAATVSAYRQKVHQNQMKPKVIKMILL